MIRTRVAVPAQSGHWFSGKIMCNKVSRAVDLEDIRKPAARH
jgi:hypothetical protein